jgi:hypothetical protein
MLRRNKKTPRNRARRLFEHRRSDARPKGQSG